MKRIRRHLEPTVLFHETQDDSGSRDNDTSRHNVTQQHTEIDLTNTDPTGIDITENTAESTATVNTPLSPVRLSYPLQNRGKGKQRRTKFTEAEDNAILQGVNKFGMGRWTKTLETYWYVFQTNQRSAVNLKDRYRCLVNRK